jgi:hypothetical protein
MTAKSRKRFSESLAYGGRGRHLHTLSQPDLRIASDNLLPSAATLLPVTLPIGTL